MPRSATASVDGRPSVALTDLDLEALDSLYLHRLLTTSQVHDLHAPGRPRRSVQRRLRHLERTGYLARMRGRPPAYEARWFLTGLGADLVETLGTVQPRPYRMDAHRAAAAKHLLAVNQVGVALTCTARVHGDEFDHRHWHHEVAHSTGPGQNDVIISDAVLTYDVWTPAGVSSQWRFLELDRGTESVHRLVAKLRGYLSYASYKPARRSDTTHLPRELWRRHYPVLPGVMFVFADMSDEAARRRMAALAGFVDSDPMLRPDERLQVTATTLEQLRSVGPFGDIFVRIPTLEVGPLHRRHPDHRHD